MKSLRELQQSVGTVLPRKQFCLFRLQHLALKLVILLCLLTSFGCSLGFETDGDKSSGDSTTGDTINASGEANVNNTNVSAGDDASVVAIPDNQRHPDGFITGGAGGRLGNGICFIEVYKPESENGTASVLFSVGCVNFASVCMFRRPLGEVPDVSATEAQQAASFEPFEEECGVFTSREQGIAKWAFKLPGKFYTGDVIAEVVGETVTFDVGEPSERHEDVPATSGEDLASED